MKIIDILEEDQILLNHHFISKKRLFETMAELLGDGHDDLDIYHALVEREKLGNTSLGNGVAVPHGKCLVEGDIRACLIKMAHEVDYETIDDVPVRIVIGIAFPQNTGKAHQELMKETAHLFRQHRLYRNLLVADSREQVMNEILNGFELCSSW